MKPVCSTQFEDLSNELFYEMFDYLDGCEITEIFFQLNSRFQNLFVNPSFRLKLHIPLTSKPRFFRLCQEVVTPNVDRIVSLSLFEHKTIDHFLESFAIDLFSRLEALRLDNISSNSLVSLLTRLSLLPRLFSLSITCYYYRQDNNAVFESIFRLPSIKYCKIHFPGGNDDTPLRYALDHRDQCQTLEYLIIDGEFRLDKLSAILTYTPRLTHLSCELRSGFDREAVKELEMPHQLTHVDFKFHSLSFDEFESFLSSICGQLQRLRVTASNKTSFLLADRWEQLILKHMPHLHIFDFLYRYHKCGPSGDDPIIIPTTFDQFTSTFWQDREWFFDFQYESSDEPKTSAINFYSAFPYRRKHFELYECMDSEVDVSSVSHLTLEGSSASDDCLIHFSNVTELTLLESHRRISDEYINNINRVVSLAHLTRLVIEDQRLRVDQLIELLWFSSNIHTLTIANLWFLKFRPLYFEEATLIRRMAQKNKIINLTIDYDCSLDHLRFFVKLCPRLQHLKISVQNKKLKLVLKFLLSKNASDLCSLCLEGTNAKVIEQIRTIIDCDKLLDDYIIKHHETGVCLWW